MGVQQENTTGLDLIHNVEGLDIALLVAGDKVRHRDIVGRTDGFVAEAQVAAGQTAGLLRVILEVGLDILIRVVTDDLAGVLVRADRAVRAETPELAGDDAFAGGHDVLTHRQRVEGDVVVDADGEVVFLLPGHIVEDGLQLGRGGVFGGKAVTAAE